MVTSADLSNLPLLHGTLFLDRIQETVTLEGLRPARTAKSVNTFSWDRLLGRDCFIYLRPFAVQNGYGNSNAVVVASQVLSIPGVRCFLHDPGEIGGMFDQIRYSLMQGPDDFCEWMKSNVQDARLATILQAVFDSLPTFQDRDWETTMRESLANSVALQDYYEEQFYLHQSFSKPSQLNASDLVGQKPILSTEVIHGRFPKRSVFQRRFPRSTSWAS